MHIPKNLVLGCPCAPTWINHLGLLRSQQLAALRLVVAIVRHWLVDSDRGRQAVRPRGRAPVVDPGQPVLRNPRHAGVGGLREADANSRASWSGKATQASGLHPLLAIGIVVFPAIDRFQDGKGGLSWVRSLRASVTARSLSAADRHTKGPAQVLADQGVGRLP